MEERVRSKPRGQGEASSSVILVLKQWLASWADLRTSMLHVSHRPAVPISPRLCDHPAALHSLTPTKARQQQVFKFPLPESCNSHSTVFPLIWNCILEISNVHKGRQNSIIKSHVHITQISTFC